jgi:hypothetical protein
MTTHEGTAPGPTVTSDPRCPRCRYQQRGAIDQWMTACPLDGTCTECGLSFMWCDVMRPNWRPPRWCLEHGSRSEFPWRIVKTLAMTLLPWMMWSRLQMNHSISAARLMAYVLSMLALGYILFAICMGVWAWAYVDGYRLGVLTTQDSPWAAAARSALLPWSDVPLGTYVEPWQGRTGEMSSPRRLLHSIASVVEHFFSILGALLMMQFIAMIAFAALPISRRRAKVRWSHIARVGVYLVGWFVPLWVLMMALGVSGHLDGVGGGAVVNRANALLGVLTPIMVLAFVPMSVVWWSMATSRYLKIPHGWGVGFSVVTIGVLAVVLIRTLPIALAF